MERFKGTTEEWSVNPVEKFYNGNKAFEINYGTDGECVAEVVHGIENANLIAAAPELLGALNALMETYDKNGHLLNFNVDIARQAINKALGKEVIL